MSTLVTRNRTNAFHVKDVDAFVADLAKYGVSVGGYDDHADIVMVQEHDDLTKVTLLVYGSWPSFDEEWLTQVLELEDDQLAPSEYEGISHLVAAHLVDTDVAVFLGNGFESMRYVGGWAVAVNAKGERRSIDLSDILELAKEIATEGTPVDMGGN